LFTSLRRGGYGEEDMRLNEWLGRSFSLLTAKLFLTANYGRTDRPVFSSKLG
jgi:hypothetical protein